MAARRLNTAITDARKEIRQLLKIIASYPVTSPPLQDQIVAYGELLSSQLLASVLPQRRICRTVR